ncbi:MAG: pectate lyase, partial [Bacteroidales bacterium]
MRKINLLIAFMAGGISLSAQEKSEPLAFPGAEGFGKYTSGGRGGNVFYVTNLENDGAGSLRWAVRKKGPKTILFNVSGTIHLKSPLDINHDSITIAGQSAPGDGICIAGAPVKVKGSNIILRYLRFRMG